MSGQTQEKFTPEFKENAVRRAAEPDNIAEVARELGVKENTLYNRVYKYSHPAEANKAARMDKHLYDELKRPKKGVARLTEERDLLKQQRALPGKRGRLILPRSSGHSAKRVISKTEVNNEN